MFGKRQIRTEIRIHASAAQVWKELTDFENYPRWNPFIRRVEGEARPGARLRVQLEPETGISMSCRPQVVRCEPERELCWRGRFLFSGLLDREHWFTIEKLDSGWVRFAQHDTFSGLLPFLLGDWLEGQIRPGFERMNRALKIRAEQMARVVPRAACVRPQEHIASGPRAQCVRPRAIPTAWPGPAWRPTWRRTSRAPPR